MAAALGHRGTTHGTGLGEERGKQEEAEGLGAGVEVLVARSILPSKLYSS
jgi:hypothetical protein